MKRMICILILLVAFPCLAVEIDLPITLPIVNRYDQSAVRLEIYRIHTGDETIWVRLFDSDDNLIEDKRVYSYAGDNKNIPTTLLNSEVEFLDGKDPSETWGIETIRLWLDSKQSRDEDGKTVADDPYGYEVGDSKDDLLGMIEII